VTTIWPRRRTLVAHLEVLEDRRCLAEIDGAVTAYDSYAAAEAQMRAADLLFTVSRFPELKPLVDAVSPVLFVS